MDKNGHIDKAFCTRLTAVFDIMVTIAAITVAVYSLCHGYDILLAAIVANSMLLLITRQWLMRTFEIAPMTSRLNVFLKKTADITISLVIALTLLPFAILLAFPVIKLAKNGAIIQTRTMILQDRIQVKGLVFRFSGTMFDSKWLNRLPMVANVLLQKISLWDIANLEEMDSPQENLPQEDDGKED